MEILDAIFTHWDHPHFLPLVRQRTPQDTACPPHPHPSHTVFHTSYLSCISKLLQAQLPPRVAELLVVLVRLEERLALLRYSAARGERVTGWDMQ